MTGITIILMVLGGLCLLLISKKTRPAAWGAVTLGVLLLVLLAVPAIYWTKGERSLHQAELAKGQAFRHPAMAEAELRRFQEDSRPEVARVDVEKLLAPSIRLGEEESASGHAHASAHPPQATKTAPDEASETTDADQAHATADDNHDIAHEATAVVESPATHSSPPEWIERLPERTGGDYHVVITTEFFPNAADAQLQADQWMMVVTDRLVRAWEGMGRWDGRSVVSPPSTNNDYEYRNAVSHLENQLGISQGEIRKRVARSEYLEDIDQYLDRIDAENVPIIQTTTPMKRVHVLLTYDNEFRDLLTQRFRQAQADRRIVHNVEAVAGTGAGVLAILSLIWGILKFDTATKGYYTKWLLGGGLAATIVAVFFFIVAVS